MKVALYARVSTEEQNIDTQLVHLREYCKRLNHTITAEYKDIGVSGAKESRPAFDEMLAAVRSHKINCIVVYKLDRIGRSLQHLINLFQELKNLKVQFISTTQNISTDTPEGKMFMRMIMVLAEYERELIVDRINSGLDRARKEGKTLGRPKGAKDKKKRRTSGYINRWTRTKK